MTYAIYQITIEGETIAEKTENIENKIMLWNGENYLEEYKSQIATIRDAKAEIENIFSTEELKAANDSKFAFAIYEESPDGLENMIFYRFKADNLTIIYEDHEKTVETIGYFVKVYNKKTNKLKSMQYFKYLSFAENELKYNVTPAYYGFIEEEGTGKIIDGRL